MVNGKASSKARLAMFFDAITVVVLVGVGALAISRRVEVNPVRKLDQRIAPEILLRWYDAGVWEGPQDAAVRIINYTDYTCHFCAEQDSALQRLKWTYPSHVAIITRIIPNPRSDVATRLALIARCSNTAHQFQSVHPLLYSIADRNSTLEETLRFLRLRLGDASVDDLVTCLDSGTSVAFIRNDIADAVQLGLDVTPVLVVNGIVRPGVSDFPTLQAIAMAEMRRVERDYLSESQNTSPNKER